MQFGNGNHCGEREGKITWFTILNSANFCPRLLPSSGWLTSAQHCLWLANISSPRLLVGWHLLNTVCDWPTQVHRVFCLSDICSTLSVIGQHRFTSFFDWAALAQHCLSLAHPLCLSLGISTSWSSSSWSFASLPLQKSCNRRGINYTNMRVRNSAIKVGLPSV